MKTSIFALVVALSFQASAGLLFHYSDLALKDLDQMSKIVQDKVKESRKSKGEKVIPLREGLQAVFSRPNDDGMIEKIVSPLKNALDENDAWEPSIKRLVDEALGALKNPKAFQPVVQVTYLVFLENLVSEFKPKAHSEFEKGMLTKIRDEKIQITKEAKHERVLRMMREMTSPSVFAEEALKEEAARAAAAPPPPVEEAPTIMEQKKKTP